MESHRYTVSWRGILSPVLVPVVGLVFWAALIHALSALNILPRSHPAVDPDQTLFRYKSDIARSKSCADMILIGDSSCTTGIDPVQLSSLLPERPCVLNLGLIIGLSLDTLISPVMTFADSNPDQVRWIVLLVTPQKLKGEDVGDHHEEMWKRLQSGQPIALKPQSASELVAHMLGLAVARDCIVSHLLHRPMEGAAAEFYGFAAGLSDHLATHLGSFVDPGRYTRPPGKHKQQPDYFISPDLETSSRRLRTLLPPGVKFAAGIMPVPEGHADSSHVAKHHRLLVEWNEWLHADLVLTNLPSRLPDGLFASGAHLNGAGQKFFTSRLAEELQRTGFVGQD